jgi:hypothetical protein
MHCAKQQKGFESKIAHQQKEIEALTVGLTEGERASRDEPPCAANGPQQSVK